MKPGYAHYPTVDDLRRGLAMTPLEVFAWLEEANAFTDRALDPETRKIWESFRTGVRALPAPPPAVSR